MEGNQMFLIFQPKKHKTAAKPDGPKPEAARPEAARPEAPKPEAARREEPKPEGGAVPQQGPPVPPGTGGQVEQ